MRTNNGTFLRFIIVGVINTIVGTTVMFISYNAMHLSYWVSSAANYVIGSVVSYFLNKNFTFKNTENGIKPVARFIINIAVCYGLAYGLAQPLVYKLMEGYSQTIRDNIAMCVGMGLFVIFNYFGQRFFAFREKEKME